jgi:hypothetical protein
LPPEVADLLDGGEDGVDAVAGQGDVVRAVGQAAGLQFFEEALDLVGELACGLEAGHEPGDAFDGVQRPGEDFDSLADLARAKQFQPFQHLRVVLVAHLGEKFFG